MPISLVDESSRYVIPSLYNIFVAHGIACKTTPERVEFPAFPNLWCTGRYRSTSTNSVELFVIFGGFDGDRFIRESFTGYGTNRDAQLMCALKLFATSTLDPLLPAFFRTSHGDDLPIEKWTIQYPRFVFAGPITTLTGYPPSTSNGMPDVGFYHAFIDRLATTNLAHGIHWIRIQHIRSNGQALQNEVMLDNCYWNEMRDFLLHYNWPKSDKTYDVRLFVIISDSIVS